MLDVTAMRAGLKLHLGNVNGGELNVYTTPVFQPEFPCAVVGFPEVAYNKAVNGMLSEVQLPVTVMVSAADLPEAVTRMDEYLGQSHPRSIQQSLVAHDSRPHWAGIVVEGATNVQLVEELGALAADFIVRVQG